MRVRQRHLRLGILITSQTTFLLRCTSFLVDRLTNPSRHSTVSFISSSLPLTFGDSTLCDKSFEDLYSSTKTPSTDDGNLHLPDWLIQRCIACGFIYPTIIQEKALNVILNGHDCVIQGHTGCGKTLAYLLPLLASIDASRSAIQAIIVVPTRELGLQVAKVAKRLAAGKSSSSHVQSEILPEKDDESSEIEIDHDIGSVTSSKKQKIMIMNVLQGSANRRQRAWAWAEPPHVVIGTPVELNKMVSKGGMRYNAVQYVVVDEVDACLGFQLQSSLSTAAWSLAGSELHELLSRYLSPTFEDSSIVALTDQMITSATDLDLLSSRIKTFKNNRQTIFASATIPQHNHFMKQCIKNKWTVQEPIFVCSDPSDLIPPTIKHNYVVCANNEQKLPIFKKLILKERERQRLMNKKAIVFFDQQRNVDEIASILAESLNTFLWKEETKIEDVPDSCEIILSVLRYEDSLSARSAAMDSFQGISIKGRFHEYEHTRPNILRILLSSDLAARGIDVNDVSHVFNYDLPDSSDVYVHRAGRTGRFGREGIVISLISMDQEFVLQRLANKLNLDIACIARQKRKT